MRRIVGKAKKKAPPKTLDDTSKGFDERLGKIDGRVVTLDKQIKDIKLKMNKMNKNSPAYRQQKQRALQLLRMRAMYEKQGDQARNQQFNIDQQAMQLEMMKATQEQVATMKDTKKVMKKQMKKINIDKVQDLKDDIDDIMEDNNEIQDILGENDMLNDLDESELDAQLDAFDEFDEALIDENEEVPNYLKDDALPSELPAVPQGQTGNLDDFGLPQPQPVAEKQANAV